MFRDRVLPALFVMVLLVSPPLVGPYFSKQFRCQRDTVALRWVLIELFPRKLQFVNLKIQITVNIISKLYNIGFLIQFDQQ